MQGKQTLLLQPKALLAETCAELQNKSTRATFSLLCGAETHVACLRPALLFVRPPLIFLFETPFIGIDPGRAQGVRGL